MPKKHGPLLKLDKDVAEWAFGRQTGRPTISRRAGRQISDVVGVNEDLGTDLFHVALVGGLIWGVAKLVASPKNPSQFVAAPPRLPQTAVVHPFVLPLTLPPTR
jgi:hypothetical protein